MTEKINDIHKISFGHRFGRDEDGNHYLQFVFIVANKEEVRTFGPFATKEEADAALTIVTTEITNSLNEFGELTEYIEQ